jgi:hypothetical protein
MKYNLKPRAVSPKDYSSRKTFSLGATVFQNELLFLSPILSQDQEDCTAFSAVAARANEIPNGDFDPMQFWEDELAFNGDKTSQGYDLETPAACGVKTGFSPTGNPTLRQNNAKVYFWITAGSGQDLFDNIRSIIQQKQLPVVGGLLWFNEWNTPDGVISDNGVTQLGGHAIKIAGWTTRNGVSYLVLQNSWGTAHGNQGLFYMPRAMVNFYFPAFGVYWWSDDANLVVQKMGLLQALLQNLVNLYKKLLNQPAGYPPKPVPVPTPVVKTKIELWADAIAKAEGAKPSLNNPGDLKYSTLTASWGGTPGFNATDGGSIAQFPTYQRGYTALCSFLRLGCENELVAFHSPEARTLEGFMNIYAGNPPSGYLNTIYASLKAEPTTQISTFL